MGKPIKKKPAKIKPQSNTKPRVKPIEVILPITIIILIAINAVLFYNSAFEEKEIPKVPVIEEPKETIEEEPEEVIEEVREPEIKEPEKVRHIIKVAGDRFIPEETTASVGDEVIWQNDGAVSFMIACYKNGVRRFFGERVWDEAGTTTHKFSERGEYLCIDTIYGLRSKIIVEPKENLITGNFMSLRESIPPRNLITILSIISLFLILFIYNSGKNKK